MSANQQKKSSINQQNPATDPQPEQLLTALKKISCLNIDKAINAMSNNRQLYLKLAKNFTHEQQQRVTELNYLFEHQDWQTIEYRAHSLKTYSAYIGAYTLSEQAAELELQCQQGSPQQTQLTHIGQLLEQLLTQLNPLFDIDTQSFNDYPINYNHSEFKRLLKTCLPLLNQGNTAVEGMLGQLHRMCQGTQHQKRIEILMAQVEEVEFDLAAQTAEQVLSELETV